MSEKPVDTSVRVTIKGRIHSAQKVGTDSENFPIIENVIIVPASDPYTTPARYCVVSKAMLGHDNDDVTVTARIVCRPWRDKEGRWRYPHQLLAF